MARWCARKGVPHFFYQHAYCPPRGWLGLGFRLWDRVFRRYAWRDSAGAFALSSAAAAYVRSLGYRGEITIATGAVDSGVFTLEGPSKLRELTGLGSEAEILLSVARLIPEKNMRFVVELARQSARQGLHFVIVGAGPEQALLEGLSRGLHNLHLIPQRIQHEELPLLYRGASLYLAPSLVEPLNFTVAEAMACGTPALVSDAGGLPDLVSDGGGCVLAVDDPASWLTRIEELLGDRAKLEALRAEATAAGRRFDWSLMAARVSESLESAVRKNAL